MSWTERFVSPTGAGAHDGTSAGDAWDLAEAIAGGNAGHRLNMIAGTYANTTTSRTFANGAGAGTTTAPKWWRGYKTAIGDMDADPASTRVAGTDIPLLTFTSGLMALTGSFQTFSNMEVRGTSGGSALVTIGTGTAFTLKRFRVDNQHADSAARAIRINSSATVILESWFKATSSAADVVMTDEAPVSIRDTQALGGGVGFNFNLVFAQGIFAGLIADNNGSHGILVAANSGTAFGLERSSVYSPGGDGLRFSSLPGQGVVSNTIFDSCGGYGINNASGANTALIRRLHCAFRGNTSGNENGFGDTPSWEEIAESSSPWTNAAGHDFSLLDTANSKAAGSPGLYENESYKSWLDIGAVQREEAGGGGGGLVSPIISAVGSGLIIRG